MVIVRTARRLRQEAGGELSPTLTAALATIERNGPLTPSELAARERIQRPTATRVVARLEEAGLVDAHAATPTTALVRVGDRARRARAAGAHPHPQERLPRAAPARRSTPTSARRSRTRPRSSSALLEEDAA